MFGAPTNYRHSPLCVLPPVPGDKAKRSSQVELLLFLYPTRSEPRYSNSCSSDSYSHSENASRNSSHYSNCRPRQASSLILQPIQKSRRVTRHRLPYARNSHWLRREASPENRRRVPARVIRRPKTRAARRRTIPSAARDKLNIAVGPLLI